MFGVILTIHIIVCLGLIIVVLLQSGKGGGLAGAFGGAGGVGAVFGGQAAATFLTKATRYLAIGFMLTSLSLAVTLRGTLRSGTVSDGLEGRQPSAATTTGEIVQQEGTAADLPGAGVETEAAGESAGAEEQGGVTGEEIPVAPETE